MIRLLWWVALVGGILLVIYGSIVGVAEPLGIPPAVIVGAALAFLSNYSLQMARNRDEREREEVLESQRAQDATVAAYTEKMSELVLEKDFLKASNDAQAPKVAQALTITTLVQLDSERKRIVLKVVYTLGLIRQDNPVLQLEGANLDHADLTEFRLRDASLRGADLRGADLQGSDLSGSDLSYADLRGVNLTNADLSAANLSGANLLPYDEQEPARLSFYNLKGHALPSDYYLRSLAKLQEEGLRDRLTRSAKNRLLLRKPVTFTNLTDAKLEGANLTGAILANADLRHTRGSLDRKQIERAIGNDKTKLPDTDEFKQLPPRWTSKGIEEQIKEVEDQIKELPSE
jgi:uncharacterized protein YjbI with pentapeptide repeats